MQADQKKMPLVAAMLKYKKEQGYQKKDFGMITGCDEVKNGYLNLTLE